MILYIENRLWQWADWSNSGRMINGYPKQTIEHRLVVEGGVLIRGTGMKLEPVNEDAEEIESAVKSLDARMRHFAKRRYLKREPAPERNRSAYYADLHRLHVQIMEWLQENG